jgi:hypothetical protein
VPSLSDQAGGTIKVLRGGEHDSHLLLSVLSGSRDARGIVDLPRSRSCRSRRSMTINVRRARGVKVRRVSIRVGSRKATVLRGRKLRRQVRLTGLPRGTYRVRITVRGVRNGKRVTLRDTRTYRTCAPRKRG